MLEPSIPVWAVKVPRGPLAPPRKPDILTRTMSSAVCELRTHNPLALGSNPRSSIKEELKQMRKMCDWFYRFMCALACIFGWPILLCLEVREHLRKGPTNECKVKIE